MENTRREFIKKATLLTGAAGLFTVLPESIQKALAIDAPKGSTFMDAEHVVFLMQENRSFDHCYGTLQGVRGFDDPRAMDLPNGNKVWAQTNAAGETYVPHNLDIKNSKATWMQSLPHSWDNQVDARNGGRMDKWLDSKRSGNKNYANMPLTLGYYDRKDIPFYYALADAFTVCDQHFCSSLTGTSPNRSYFWAGTLRQEQNENSPALVWNEEFDYKDLDMTAFPERLEQLGISWRIYQNELSVGIGLDGEKDDWLGNFTDNNIEFHKRFNVRLHKAHLDYLAKAEPQLEKELAEAKLMMQTPEQTKAIKEKTAKLEKIKAERARWTQERFDKLSEFEKNLHRKAFTTNVNDPHYHELETITYDDNGTKREMKVPKGDILHQFRHDVNNGKLPTVSWLAAPSNFSDHPGSPWYGAWYVSEVLDILTKNPEVWKKTIFILTYDENDGYFDHVAPFVPPHTARPETGKTSAGLDTAVEHVTLAQEEKRGWPAKYRRESPIGLGYRVPMVIASPWTRGGWVNSQVFDHTSCLQFLEKFLSRKTGKPVKETNISDWRRTVCGDLTSIFRPYNGEKINYPASLNRNESVIGIQLARYKDLPSNFKALTADDIKLVNRHPALYKNFPKQEKGSRQSCALPYDLQAGAKLNTVKDTLTITMGTGKGVGAPFTICAPGKYEGQQMRIWDFAVKPNDALTYQWPLKAFENGTYSLRLNGPNGFFRTFAGDKNDPELDIKLVYKPSGDLELHLYNIGKKQLVISVADRSYHQKPQSVIVGPGAKAVKLVSLQASHNWYDVELTVNGHPNFAHRYAGRVETGKAGLTDPLIGA